MASSTLPEDEVDAAKAAGDEASMCEVGLESANAKAKLPASLADDIHCAALEGSRAAPRPLGAAKKGAFTLSMPAPDQRAEVR